MLLSKELLIFRSFGTSSFFVQPKKKKTSTMINATLYEEMTFHVRCDPLSDSPPNNKKTITTPVTTVVYRGSSWQVDLSRFAENLQIGLKWSAQSTYDSFRGNVYCYPPQFLSMYVVHHNRGYSCCPVDTNAFKNKERCQSRYRSGTIL